MPLPAGFPTLPKRPPAGVAIANADGSPNRAWLDYFDRLDRFHAALVQFLNGL